MHTACTKKFNFYMSFSLTNHSRENFIYSWEVILLLIFLHADKLEELKFTKRKFFLNSDPIPCSQDKWPRNLAPHAMICLSSITLIISSYEDRNQRRCLEDKKISLMFLEHLRTSSNNIYIFGEAGEICLLRHSKQPDTKTAP